jgi:uncharacterized protein
MALTDLLFQKQKDIEKRLGQYLDHWWGCVECFDKGMTAYLEEGPGESVDFYYSRVDREESKGDELRRGVETDLYAKALMPEARGDILRTLEALDKVINRVESIIRQLVVERVKTEPWMNASMARLTQWSLEACRALHEAGTHLNGGNDDAIPALVRKVSEFETRCDHIEEDLLGKVFSSDLELARKLQLKDLVRRIGTITDLAEAAGDTLHIVSIKRRV